MSWQATEKTERNHWCQNDLRVIREEHVSQTRLGGTPAKSVRWQISSSRMSGGKLELFEIETLLGLLQLAKREMEEGG